ncbi:MAG: hypothetical protein Aurels2KO_42980 [Aureliella sp.]
MELLKDKLPRLLLLQTLLLPMYLGCAEHAQIQRRSVTDLYRDAVHSSLNRVQTVSSLPGAARRHDRYVGTSPTEQLDDSLPYGRPVSSEDDSTLQPSQSIPTPTTDDVKLHLSDSEALQAALNSAAGAQQSNPTAGGVALASAIAPGAASTPDSAQVSSGVQLASGARPVKVIWDDEATPLNTSPVGYAQPPAEERISEYFEETELREAIDILASMTGDKVIVDESVGGIVTAQIDDATFAEALEQLLLQQGYVYAIHDGAYVVAPPDPESPLFPYVSKRNQYTPHSHLPSKLVELLPTRYRDYYQLSDERNLIVIDAPAEIGTEILTRLQELDSPVQQVELEAIVCVTLPDSGFRFGMDWNHVLALDSTDQLSVGMSGLALSAAGSSYGLNNAFDDFAITSAFVQALSQEGYVSIRAQPRVTAKDGEKASISIARETFFSLQPANSSVLFRQDVQKVDAGISLEITPRIRGDIVSVSIERAEVSEDIRSNSSNPELSNNPYPIINRRLVSTEVDVRDGHTIVIGGLVQRQTVDRINQIPVLGSIPLLGRLFQTIEKQEQDAEVAIFISPRIVPYE